MTAVFPVSLLACRKLTIYLPDSGFVFLAQSGKRDGRYSFDGQGRDTSGIFEAFSCGVWGILIPKDQRCHHVVCCLLNGQGYSTLFNFSNCCMSARFTKYIALNLLNMIKR